MEISNLVTSKKLYKTPRPMSEARRIRKPLMERKRRERINSSLERLAMLLKEANLVAPDKPIMKLEKADILELTVRHLTNLRTLGKNIKLEVASSSSENEKDCNLSTKDDSGEEKEILQKDENTEQNTLNNFDRLQKINFMSLLESTNTKGTEEDITRKYTMSQHTCSYMKGFLKCIETIEETLIQQGKQDQPVQQRLIEHLTRCLHELSNTYKKNQSLEPVRTEQHTSSENSGPSVRSQSGGNYSLSTNETHIKSSVLQTNNNVITESKIVENYENNLSLTNSCGADKTMAYSTQPKTEIKLEQKYHIRQYDSTALDCDFRASQTSQSGLQEQDSECRRPTVTVSCSPRESDLRSGFIATCHMAEKVSNVHHGQRLDYCTLRDSTEKVCARINASVAEAGLQYHKSPDNVKCTEKRKFSFDQKPEEDELFSSLFDADNCKHNIKYMSRLPFRKRRKFATDFDVLNEQTHKRCNLDHERTAPKFTAESKALVTSTSLSALASTPPKGSLRQALKRIENLSPLSRSPAEVNKSSNKKRSKFQSNAHLAASHICANSTSRKDVSSQDTDRHQQVLPPNRIPEARAANIDNQITSKVWRPWGIR